MTLGPVVPKSFNQCDGRKRGREMSAYGGVGAGLGGVGGAGYAAQQACWDLSQNTSEYCAQVIFSKVGMTQFAAANPRGAPLTLSVVGIVLGFAVREGIKKLLPN